MPPSTDRTGQLLDGRYEIHGLVGRGAMADVFRARDHRLGRDVAVKILRQSVARDPDAVERFRREARVQALVRHRNVAALLGGGVTDRSEPFLVFELLRGRSLRTVIRRRKRVPLARAAGYCEQALRGLTAVHAVGIHHRDLKPANLMLEPGDGGHERVALIDFGFASLEGAHRLTMRGHVVGSLSYMAPERLHSDVCDERSEVYSMAVVLYELLVGRPPFVADDDHDLIHAHLETAPTPPTTLDPECDCAPAVETLILRSLEKDPARRPQSAEEMREELRPWSPAADEPRRHRVPDPQT